MCAWFVHHKNIRPRLLNITAHLPRNWNLLKEELLPNFVKYCTYIYIYMHIRRQSLVFKDVRNRVKCSLTFTNIIMMSSNCLFLWSTFKNILFTIILNRQKHWIFTLKSFCQTINLLIKWALWCVLLQWSTCTCFAPHHFSNIQAVKRSLFSCGKP